MGDSDTDEMAECKELLEGRGGDAVGGFIAESGFEKGHLSIQKGTTEEKTQKKVKSLQRLRK